MLVLGIYYFGIKYIPFGSRTTKPCCANKVNMQCATKTVKLHKDIAKDMQSNDGHLNSCLFQCIPGI